MATYNPKDIFVSQKDSTGLNFQEKVLTAVSNSYVFFDNQLNLTTITTGSLPQTASWAINAVSTSFVTQAESASFAITTSFALNAGETFTGKQNYNVPVWINNQLSATSSISVDSDTHVVINNASFPDPSSKEVLILRQPNENAYSAIRATGKTNNYFQLVMQNESTGSDASTDLIADSDEGITGGNFIDLGINSSQYSNPAYDIGGPNDGYLYVDAGVPGEGNLSIGTRKAGTVVKFHAGGTTADKEVARATEAGFFATGSLLGTAATASFLSGNGVVSGSLLYSTSSDVKFRQEGRTFWDYDAHTLAIIPDKTGSTLQVGQEMWLRAVGHEFIPNGSAVYFDDAVSGVPCVSLALADGTGTKDDVVGVSTEDIPSGSVGLITIMGQVHELNTLAYPKGTLLYLSTTTSGSFQSTPPLDPHETVAVARVLIQDVSVGVIEVKVSNLGAKNYPFVGLTTIPTIVSSSVTATGSIVTVGAASANFCQTADGAGLIKNYPIPSASFVITASFLDVQYIMATYNSGSPVYFMDTTRDAADSIQTTVISTIVPISGGRPSFANWGDPGILLANKDYLRVQALRRIERQDGLVLSVYDQTNRYFSITEGTAWQGVTPSDLLAINSTVNRVVLVAHSASVWSGSLITQLTNTQCDNGTDIVDLGAGADHWVVNYVYRTIGTLNATVVMYSQDYTSVTDAIAGGAPVSPSEFLDTAFLVSRVIYKKSIVPEVQVDSAYTKTYVPAGITIHSQLSGLDGGNSTLSNYYHLTLAEYGNTTSGSFLRQTSSADIALLGTASQAKSASYIIPGATFQIVSGSNGVSPAFIEPYDTTTGVYVPPFKEGRMWYDNQYHNMDYYTEDSGFRAQLCKELIIGVHNPYPTQLDRLTVVYVSGSTGNRPSVYKALADATGTKSKIIGVVRSNIASGSNGYMLTRGVMHRSNMATYDVGQALWLSPTVDGAMTTTKPEQPYQSVLVGYCSETGAQGSFVCAIQEYPIPANAYAGITSDIILTNNLSGSIYVSSGSVNLFADSTGLGQVTGYALLPATLSLTTGSTNYLTAWHSGSDANAKYELTTDSTFANGISIVRVATLDIYNATTSSWDVHQFNVGIVGLALANRINNKDIRLYGYQRELGLTLYTTGSSGSFGITNGTIWYGPNSHIVPTFDTTLTDHYTYLFVSSASNGTSSWQQTTQSVYDNLYYNSASYGLVPLAQNSWSVNFVYRLMGTDDESAIVLSSQQFTTKIEATDNAETPPNLPSTIADIGLLVGRFIVQSGSFVPTIESAFASLFIPSVVTDHESLTGLQGGTGGQHYHMTFADYTGTGTGVMVRQSQATMSNPMFVGATVGNVPYWDSHQQLTLTGSIQVVNDQYVLINSASLDPINPEALTVFQKHSSSVNVIGAYGNIDNFFEIYVQNQSSSKSASSDICATADIGTVDNNYIDMGIAGSNYTGSAWPWTKALDGYLLVDGGDLWLANTTNGKKIRFLISNSLEVGVFDQTGLLASGSLIGTASWANSAVTASYAPVEPAYSSSVSSAKQNTLVVGGTYTITSSWATNANTASYVNRLNQDVTVTGSVVVTNTAGTSLYVQGTGGGGAGGSSAGNIYFRCDTTSGVPENQVSIEGSKDPVTPSGQVGGQLIVKVSNSSGGSSERIRVNRDGQIILSGSVINGPEGNVGAIGFFGNLTGSVFGTASWATTASWSNTASFALAAGSGGTTLITGSIYPITASWSGTASLATSASYATTASYALGIPTIKSGQVSGSLFAGNPKIHTVVFGTAYPNNLYSAIVTGEPSRTWTILNKSGSGFTINANNNTAFTSMVFWQTITQGEFYN
jgi:hypothetical protein